MKTKLILASFAISGIINAQNEWAGPGSNNTTGSIYRTGNIGVGMSSASGFKLGVTTSGVNDGISVVQTGTSAAVFHLNNTAASGKDWSIMSSGTGNTQGAGHFFFMDWSNGTMPFFIQGSTYNTGIGTTSPASKLHVVGTTLGIRGDAGSSINNTGVLGNGYYGVDGSGGLVGVRGNCYVPGGVANQGIRGNAASGASNVAGWFQSGGGAGGVVSYGVLAEVVTPTLGGTNYGIYSSVGGNNNLGTGPNYAGYFNGDVVTAGGSYFYSDGRIKKNVSSIKSSLSIIQKLNPVSYNFNTEDNKNLALPAENQYGFISQEVEKILPELTKKLIHPASFDEIGRETSPKKEVLGLNYNGFISILTKGIQEQQELILNLENQLNEHKKLIDDMNNKLSGTTGINSLNTVETGFQMSQNEPNPFTHETVVKYTLPQSVTNAFMAVYDLTGKQITTFPINEKGSSSLTITSDKLSAGIYIYSIVADGKVIDSKRMIVSEK